MDIRQRIRQFMLAELRDNGFSEAVGDSDSLIDAEIMDSLGVLTLISFLGEEFGIVPEEEELDPDHFRSIDVISDYVAKKLAL